jgi:outer membrane protein assembly factor BamB
MSALRVGVCMLAAALAAGCAFFEPAKPKPEPLEDIKPQIAGRMVWSQRVGDLGPLLAPTANATAVTVASLDGRVVAFAPDTGRELWRGDVDAKLSAGVGSDGRFAAVVTTANDLVVLDAGKPTWRARLSTRIVTPPLVAGERVFVLGVDRSVQAFDALDGRKLWAQQRPSDPLTLLQPGVLMAWKDTLVAGQGPRLAGFDPLRGTLRWETTVASPRGTNEVERLADLVGPAARTGDTICARGFQAAVGCVDAAKGSRCGRVPRVGWPAWRPTTPPWSPPTRWGACRRGRRAVANRCGTATASSTARSARRWRSSASWCSAMATGCCTSSTATAAARCCACRPTAGRSSPRRCAWARR